MTGQTEKNDCYFVYFTVLMHVFKFILDKILELNFSPVEHYLKMNSKYIPNQFVIKCKTFQYK